MVTVVRSICLCLIISMAGVARADDPAYLLPKLGLLDIRERGVDATMAGAVTGGWRVHDRISIELEALHTLQAADYDASAYGAGMTGSYEVGTVAVYGGLRLPVQQAVYLKARAGILHERIRASLPDRDSYHRDTGIAAGGGVGLVVASRLTMELEASMQDREIFFYSLALHYRFQ